MSSLLGRFRAWSPDGRSQLLPLLVREVPPEERPHEGLAGVGQGRHPGNVIDGRDGPRIAQQRDPALVLLAGGSVDEGERTARGSPLLQGATPRALLLDSSGALDLRQSVL